MVKYILGRYDIESIAFDSEMEMNNYLSRCDFAVKLGSEEYVQSFDCLIIRCSGLPIRYGVGIYSSTASIKPALLLLPSKSCILLGFNERIHAFGVPRGEIIFEVRLPSSFFTMVEIEAMNAVLVVHELGVVMMNYEGNEIWAFDGSDVLEEWSLYSDRVSLGFMEGNKVILDLLSGTLN